MSTHNTLATNFSIDSLLATSYGILHGTEEDDAHHQGAETIIQKLTRMTENFPECETRPSSSESGYESHHCFATECHTEATLLTSNHAASLLDGEESPPSYQKIKRRNPSRHTPLAAFPDHNSYHHYSIDPEDDIPDLSLPKSIIATGESPLTSFDALTQGCVSESMAHIEVQQQQHPGLKDAACENGTNGVSHYEVDEQNHTRSLSDGDDQQDGGHSTSENDEPFCDSSALSPPSLSKADKLSKVEQCVVCGDKSMGYHYKAIVCEGCKGFFRRSVHKNSRFKCHSNDQCIINKATRNRCKACRFKKCLQVGMCKESVHKDQNKKRKRTPLEDFDTFLPEISESLTTLVDSVVEAHTSTYTVTDIQPTMRNFEDDISKNVMWENDSDFSSAGISRIIEFAKRVPGFSSLSTNDQVTLLKSACIEIMILRFCTRYYPETDNFYFPNGNGISRKVLEGCLHSLANGMINLSNTLINLNIDETELSLMQSLCLLSSARPGLEYRQQVQHLEEQMSTALMIHVCNRRLTRPLALHDIVKKIFDLREMGRCGSQILVATKSIGDL